MTLELWLGRRRHSADFLLKDEGVPSPLHPISTLPPLSLQGAHSQNTTIFYVSAKSKPAGDANWGAASCFRRVDPSHLAPSPSDGAPSQA